MLLRLINLDLQDDRTKEVIELIIKNIDTYKSHIYSSKELKGLVKTLV